MDGDGRLRGQEEGKSQDRLERPERRKPCITKISHTRTIPASVTTSEGPEGVSGDEGHIATLAQTDGLQGPIQWRRSTQRSEAVTFHTSS